MANALSFASINSKFEYIGFIQFHDSVVNELITERNHLIKKDLKGTSSLSLISTGAAYTYRFAGDQLAVEAGDHGETVVELSEQDFSTFFHEVLTISGLVAIQRITFLKGDIGGFRRWEPALRALYSGRPIYDSAVKDLLLDLDGKPIDLQQKFSFTDFGSNAESMKHFLKTVGYLHITNVFSRHDISEIQSEVRNAVDLSSPEDGKSWWSTLENGTEVATRINYLNRFSDFFDDLGTDSRIQKIGKLLDVNHRVCLDRVDGPMVFIKSPNVATGLANLLWHKDCDLGGHPIMCPLIQLGIQLDAANAENGQVKMLAGSHRYSNHLLEMGKEGDLPVVPIVSNPGDVTLHYGDTLHCTPAPTSDNACRKVLYYKFEKPSMFDVIPSGAHYNDILFKQSTTGRVATRANTWKGKEQLDGV